LTSINISKIENYTALDINNTVKKCLNNLQKNEIDFNKPILLKPNLCYYWDYTTGQTTDPRIVASIIDWIKEKNEKAEISIIESDASAMKTKYSFNMLGYQKLALDKNIKLINLSQGEIEEKEVQIDGEKYSIPFNKIILEPHTLINIPKFKTHSVIGFTCALKNIFGTISKPRKYSYHKNLAKIIVAANKLIKSDIVLVDGVIVSGKIPKKLGLVISGNDPLAVDLFLCKMIGFNFNRSEYLKLAIKEKIGSYEEPKICADKSDIDYLKNNFPKYNYYMDNKIWNMEIKLLKLYTKIVDDVLEPALESE